MPAATIATIDTLALRIPLDIWAPPPQFAGRPRTYVDMLLVRVGTNGGVVGWGEAYGSSAPMIPTVFDTWLRHSAVGQDASDPDLSARLERLLHGFGRSGPVIHAISGLDIALWDIRGKLEGVPVWKLLGGARRKRVDAYASLLQYGGALEHLRRHAARARGRLSRNQAARAHRRQRRRGARGGGAGHPDHGRYQLRLDAGAGDRGGRRHGAIKAVLGRGADLAAGGFRLARRAQARDRRAAGDGRERERRARLPQDGGGRSHRFRAAEHREDRRLDQPVAHCDRGRAGRRHLRAARVLLRAGLSRDLARARRQGAPRAARAPVRRRRLYRLCQDRAGGGRRDRRAGASRPGRRSRARIDRALPSLSFHIARGGRRAMTTMSRRAWMWGTAAVSGAALLRAREAAAQAYPQRPVK